jgi:hypothetical protein
MEETTAFSEELVGGCVLGLDVTIMWAQMLLVGFDL